MKRPASPRSPYADTHGAIGGFKPRAEFVLIQSCGYRGFWGLFGVLAAFWRVFEVAVQLRNLRTSSGLVALGGLYRDNMQVSSLIRNRKMLELAL